ncbi:MAG TPA: hypothetical protein VNZ94_01860 [Xanthobacteraceae bacterium]|nr:hypothetical protein [Xanthobacteraceae bacterium]
MFDASDAIVIACAAFCIGMFAGVWVYAGRVDRRDSRDPMGEPFGDLPHPPVSWRGGAKRSERAARQLRP